MEAQCVQTPVGLMSSTQWKQWMSLAQSAVTQHRPTIGDGTDGIKFGLELQMQLEDWQRLQQLQQQQQPGKERSSIPEWQPNNILRQLLDEATRAKTDNSSLMRRAKTSKPQRSAPRGILEDEEDEDYDDFDVNGVDVGPNEDTTADLYEQILTMREKVDKLSQESQALKQQKEGDSTLPSSGLHIRTSAPARMPLDQRPQAPPAAPVSKDDMDIEECDSPRTAAAVAEAAISAMGTLQGASYSRMSKSMLMRSEGFRGEHWIMNVEVMTGPAGEEFDSPMADDGVPVPSGGDDLGPPEGSEATFHSPTVVAFRNQFRASLSRSSAFRNSDVPSGGMWGAMAGVALPEPVMYHVPPPKNAPPNLSRQAMSPMMAAKAAQEAKAAAQAVAFTYMAAGKTWTNVKPACLFGCKMYTRTAPDGTQEYHLQRCKVCSKY